MRSPVRPRWEYPQGCRPSRMPSMRRGYGPAEPGRRGPAAPGSPWKFHAASDPLRTSAGAARWRVKLTYGRARNRHRVNRNDAGCCGTFHVGYTIFPNNWEHGRRVGRKRQAVIRGAGVPGALPKLAQEKAVTVTDPVAPAATPRAAPAATTRLTPPTLADVAEKAGVSSATASRVLTGSARVRPQTRDKVQQAMTSLGYVRNRAARSADHQRAGSIALVFCEENVKVFADPYFARMLWSLSKALASADLQLILLTLHSPHDYHTVSRYLRGGHVDGALFVSMHSKADFDFAGLGIPLVLCGRPVSGADHLSYVDADNVDGARKAVAYLLDSGRKAVATIAGPLDMSPGIDRLVGYRKAMTTVGVSDPGMIAYGDFSLVSGEHAMY